MAAHSDLATGLSHFDALAVRFVEKAAPVRFALAQSTAEKRAVYRLRYNVIIERGWGRPETYQEQVEQDRFDERAIHVVGWHQGTVAASNRIVFPGVEQDLPTEAAFELAIEPHGRVADWSRTIVAREYSSDSHRIFVGLIGQSWIETRRHGYSLVCGIFTPGMMRLYRRLGFIFQTLSSPRNHFNEQRVAVRLNIEATMTALQERLFQQPRSTAAPFGSAFSPAASSMPRSRR